MSSKKRQVPKVFKLWREAAMARGYLLPGDFKKVPKKGTRAYDELRRDFDELKKRADGKSSSKSVSRSKARSSSKSRSKPKSRSRRA